MRILFGSCNKHDQPQPLWSAIARLAPAAWVWAGDAAYHDRGCGVDCFVEGAPDAMADAYARQRAVPGYAALRERVPMYAQNPRPHYRARQPSLPTTTTATSPRCSYGTWDDHDYGRNDGDRTYEHRNTSQRLFLDFIDEPAGSARRTRAGVYESHDLADVRTNRSAKLVLLDVRYSRDPYTTRGGDFLGEAQWAWLEATLRASEADVHLIVSGLQVLPHRRPFGEGWFRFPSARARLLELLLRLRVRAPVILSGDVHYAELLEATCTRGDAEARLVEITSSGLTHAFGHRHVDGGAFDLPGPPSQFSLIESAAQGVLGYWLMRWAQIAMPFRYRRRAADGAAQYHLGLNFGEVSVAWGELPAGAVIIRIRDGHGNSAHAAAFALSDLGAAAGPEESAEAADAGHWTCRGRRADPSDAHVRARLCLFLAPIALGLLGPTIGPVVAACACATAARRRRARRRDARAKAD